MKRVVNVDTRPNENAQAVRTVLTLDYTGVTVADLMDPAEDSLVIGLQGRWRRGVKATPSVAIPKTLTVVVKDLIAQMKSRSQAPLTVDGLAAVAATMTEAERKALIEKLMAGNKKAA